MIDAVHESFFNVMGDLRDCARVPVVSIDVLAFFEFGDGGLLWGGSEFHEVVSHGSDFCVVLFWPDDHEGAGFLFFCYAPVRVTEGFEGCGEGGPVFLHGHVGVCDFGSPEGLPDLVELWGEAVVVDDSGGLFELSGVFHFVSSQSKRSFLWYQSSCSK